MKPEPEIFFSIEPIEKSDQPRSARERDAVGRLIRRLCGEDARLAHTAAGAPYLLGSPLNISISHSRNFAALAWSHACSFGIDIEEPRPDQLNRVATRFLSDDELSYYSSIPDGLLKAWTLKEASFKALQSGPLDLRRYRLPLSDGNNIISVHDCQLKIVYSGLTRESLFISIVRRVF